LKHIGPVYLHAVTDTYSSSAFGFLHTSKQLEAAVDVLQNDVLTYYMEREFLPLTTILTDNVRDFRGKDIHPYEIYLELNDIERRQTKVHMTQTNHILECLNGTVLDEFFRTAFRTRFYEKLEELQADLDDW